MISESEAMCQFTKEVSSNLLESRLTFLLRPSGITTGVIAIQGERDTSIHQPAARCLLLRLSYDTLGGDFIRGGDLWKLQASFHLRPIEYRAGDSPDSCSLCDQRLVMMRPDPLQEHSQQK